MIELINVSKTYKLKKGLIVKALQHVHLTLPDRGIVFLLGKSGCGKSTLLNVIGGLDYYDKGGDIVVDGKSTKDFKPKDFDNFRNHYIGFIFQEFHLLETMTVIENVRFSLELQGLKKQDAQAAEILNRVGLDDCGNRRVLELSGGQKQRVAIARALIKSPKLILADEPTGDLDSHTGEQIFELLKTFSKDVLVVVVTHDRDSATRYGDRVIELSDGEIISDTEESAREDGEKKAK